MSDFTALNKKQFLLEQTIRIFLIEGIIITFFFTSNVTLILFLLAAEISMEILLIILKKQGKWHKYKSKSSRVFNVIQVVIIWTIFTLSRNHVFFIWASLIYPLLVLLFIAYTDYKQ